MRTQWQFGPGDGNIPARALMGNPHVGNAWQPAGKSNRTLSRKINSARRHFFMMITSCVSPDGLHLPGAGDLVF